LLLQKDLEIEERDFFREPFSEAEIRELAATKSLTDIFAWRSPSLKKLGLAGEDLSDGRMMELMLQEPRLIRRPMLRIGGELVVGGSIKVVEAALEGIA
jgi:arsenate reductase-like glutaredoxin family protein